MVAGLNLYREIAGLSFLNPTCLHNRLSESADNPWKEDGAPPPDDHATQSNSTLFNVYAWSRYPCKRSSNPGSPTKKRWLSCDILCWQKQSCRDVRIKWSHNAKIQIQVASKDHLDQRGDWLFYFSCGASLKEIACSSSKWRHQHDDQSQWHSMDAITHP